MLLLLVRENRSVRKLFMIFCRNLGREQEEKISSQSELIKNQTDEMNRLNSSADEIEKYIRDKETEINRLDEELSTKNKAIEESLTAQNELTNQV